MLRLSAVGISDLQAGEDVKADLLPPSPVRGAGKTVLKRIPTAIAIRIDIDIDIDI